MNHTGRLYTLLPIRKLGSTKFYSNSSSHEWVWRKPKGYDTGVTIYNSIVGAETPLILKNERLATWYTCGPTVYDEAHIGHASCYVKFDIMRRVLESFFNVDVIMVMGITDIDDKIINRCREMNLSIGQLTSQFEKEFYYDMARLRVQPPTIVTRVTDHIPQIISFCDSLLKKGFAYISESGTLYFDTSKTQSYGKLGSSGNEEEEEGATNEKRGSRDFALWKGIKPGEPWWDTPWGKGRPGWHIECSAMASHVFGSELDIHSGGVDLKFPHHENEETQCEAYHNRAQWSNYWIHSGHLIVKDDSAKMSKSLKNTLSIKEFLKTNTVNDFRVFCLMKKYRDVIEYSDESLNKAKSMVKKFKTFLEDCDAYVDGHLLCAEIDDSQVLQCLNETRIKIKEALKNDFNTAKSLSALEELIGKVHTSLQCKNQSMSSIPRSVGVVVACSSYVSKILDLLGVTFPIKSSLHASSDIKIYALPVVMDSIVEFRKKVRHYALTTGASAAPQSSTSHETQRLGQNESPGDAKASIEKSNTEWTTKVTKQMVKLEKKEREPLLLACDDIRDKLLTVGIQIKDRGKGSDWSLLEDRSLEARRSRNSSQDSFDPEYKPREPA